MAQLITVAEAKLYLKIDSPIIDEDHTISMLIDQATSKLQRKYGRDLVYTTYIDEEYSGEGHDYLILRNYPIESILSVTVSNDPIPWNVTDVWVNKDSGFLQFRGGRFPAGVGNIKVSYTAGFNPVPDWLKSECLLLVADLYEGRGGSL